MYEKDPSNKITDQIHDEEMKLKRKKADTMRGSFGNVFKGFKQTFEPIRILFGMFNSKQIAFSTPERKMREEAKKKAETSAYVLYDIYKKAHGMSTW